MCDRCQAPYAHPAGWCHPSRGACTWEGVTAPQAPSAACISALAPTSAKVRGLKKGSPVLAPRPVLPPTSLCHTFSSRCAGLSIRGPPGSRIAAGSGASRPRTRRRRLRSFSRSRLSSSSQKERLSLSLLLTGASLAPQPRARPPPPRPRARPPPRPRTVAPPPRPLAAPRPLTEGRTLSAFTDVSSRASAAALPRRHMDSRGVESSNV